MSERDCYEDAADRATHAADEWRRKGGDPAILVGLCMFYQPSIEAALEVAAILEDMAASRPEKANAD